VFASSFSLDSFSCSIYCGKSDFRECFCLAFKTGGESREGELFFLSCCCSVARDQQPVALEFVLLWRQCLSAVRSEQ